MPDPVRERAEISSTRAKSTPLHLGKKTPFFFFSFFVRDVPRAFHKHQLPKRNPNQNPKNKPTDKQTKEKKKGERKNQRSRCKKYLL